MAKNIIYNDTAKEVIFAVGADYSSGDYIADGGKGGISLNDVASGDDAVVAARCVVEGYPKAAGETWDEGGLLYFDAASNEFTTTEQADGLYRGKAYKAALLDATTGDVEIIDPIPDDIFEASEIPYDNSTSALAATTVQAAIDEVEDRVDDLESDKMDLVAAPVAGDLIEMDATGQGVPSGLATADVQVLTVPTAAGNLAGLTALGALADSGVDPTNLQVLTVPVAAHSLAALTALGALESTAILAADMAAAAVAGAVYGDQMRNSSATAQSTADSTATLIDLEVVELVGDVTYDAGVTSLATIPAGADGLYAIVYGATFATGGGTYNRLEIKINGVTRTDDEGTPDNANPVEVVGNTILRLAAGDTVGLYAQQDSGGALDVTSAYLAIQRIQ